MLKSLRTRIFISHLAVIGLVFLLTFIVAFVPIRRAQSLLEVRRLQDLTRPVAVQTGFVLQRQALGAAVVGELLDAQARQLQTRILLIGASGQVLHDSLADDPVNSQIANRLTTTAAQLPRTPRTPGPLGRVTADVPVRYAGVLAGQRLVVAGVPQVDDRYVALIAPVQRFPLARELFLPLILAAAVGMAGAIIATSFLSRSIARPITRLTEAANAVAVGDLEHQVPGEGDDEVGRLIHSFNSMVVRLRTTYDSQRRLLANVAHELRTPLTSIQGYAQGLNDGVFATDDARREALTAIGEESERVNELVVQILQLARLESGLAEPQRRAFDVSELIARIVRRHRTQADAKGITLDGPAASVPIIEGDEALLDQAIDNLVRNAIRHTPASGSVRISVAQTVNAGSTHPLLRIRVSDTGSGIANDDIPRVFDRFFRAGTSEGAEVADTQSFGLGLAIVREIVSSHHGTVGVESQPGEGTSFCIDLPIPSAYANGRVPRHDAQPTE